ncbi:SDR family oxidoreductase [Marinomonas pollencensis]|uniref:NAD(P)-dependent dehydrogenase (Short-subunit alcohol dehydrogenase family) n=1 Tax=Marinomonas pollencensis TaxID=491954 RepID=A0A3E0DMB6_9GAMM|nr:SDR family oxidoreductase [Marinomonas pollencensis]REG83807.1 NAD(P)-dependent dehydrogenase (short-subunit alcohol dehydrogenase family) [Marinomonas pollencensis]
MKQAVILITGGSRGIGAATARLAAQQGYCVIINYRIDIHEAQKVARDIQQCGGIAHCLQADVSQPEQVKAMFDYIRQKWGAIRALVNSAGILSKQTRFVDTTPERWQALFQTNVFGTMSCCQQAFTHMATSLGGQGGSIVNVSSIAALYGSPNEYVDYAASKGAIDSFTKGFALEVANEGIRVNGVRPGLIYTQMHAEGGEVGRVDRLAPTLPLKRGGKPEEVAEAIMWLISPKSSYSTANFIDVGGGR